MGAGGIGVIVFGATGAVGRDLLGAMPSSELPIGEVRLVGSRHTLEDSIEAFGEQQRIHRMPEALHGSPLLEGMDLAIFATPPEISSQYVPQVAEEGLGTIEIGGALAGQVPIGVVGVSDYTNGFIDSRVVSSPSGPTVGLSHVLAPLWRIGATSCRGTVLLSAGIAGKAGMTELGDQILASYSGAEPPRESFPSGLAFDLVSQVGQLQDGWTAVERRIGLETAGVLGCDPDSIELTAVLVPTFAGIGFSIHVELEGISDIEDVVSVLEESPTLRVGDPVPGPRRLVGHSKVHVGRFRIDSARRGFHLWASMDNLRAGASTNVIEIARHLWKEGLL